jgi:hypothetical protein
MNSNYILEFTLQGTGASPAFIFYQVKKDGNTKEEWFPIDVIKMQGSRDG